MSSAHCIEHGVLFDNCIYLVPYTKNMNQISIFFFYIMICFDIFTSFFPKGKLFFILLQIIQLMIFPILFAISYTLSLSA